MRFLKPFLCSRLGNVMLGTHPKETIQQHHTALVLELLKCCSTCSSQNSSFSIQQQMANLKQCATLARWHATIITVATGPHRSLTSKGGNYTHMLVTIKNMGVCMCRALGSGKQQQQLRLLSSCKVLGTQHVFSLCYHCFP